MNNDDYNKEVTKMEAVQFSNMLVGMQPQHYMT